MGDGIMAFFGAPIAHEAHAARACYAALSLQEDLRRLATPERKERLPEQRARAGESKQRQDVAEQQVRHKGNRTPEIELRPTRRRRMQRQLPRR